MSLDTATPVRPTILAADDFAVDSTAAEETNLDYAATTPPLVSTVEAVLRLLPTYGSVHRGGGTRSAITTDAFEGARASVSRFLDVTDEHSTVFVRNTTEAINVVASLLPPGARVLCSPFEHHANLLPWRRRTVTNLPFCASSAEFVEMMGDALAEAAALGRPYALVAITGASNVTGEMPPLGEIIALGHEYGAEVLVDAAQLAPHREISVRSLDVDYLAVSGHKLYAPFGTGALVLRRRTIDHRPPLLHGGGAVRVVTLDDVVWNDAPHRFEAGTPNVVGAVALGASCDALGAWGMTRLADDERLLARRLWQGLESIEGLRTLRLWDDAPDVVGVATFVVDDVDSRWLARHLAEQWRISLRSGLFCAHPLVYRLLGLPASSFATLAARARAGEDVTLPGALRASLGIGVTPADIDRLLEALASTLATQRSRPTAARTSAQEQG
jgi:selenocysteine lyase/cysteine desulfurase